MRSRVKLLTVVVGLVVASCGGGESSETTPPDVAATTSSPATTMPTATTTSLVEESLDSDTGPFPVGEPVDLLVLSDSGGCCGTVAPGYALSASEALDREVRIHDEYVGGLVTILERVQSGLADEVAEAEIIVLYGHPDGLEYDLPLPNIHSCFDATEAVEDPDYLGDWTLGQEWEEIPVIPTVEDWQPLRDAMDQIYAEIWKLRDGQPTILRAYDIYNGFLAPWIEVGVEEECTANWEVQTQVVREAAEANGAGFVSLFGIFNGPNHDEDPREKGWMAEDGFHAGEAGLDVVAEALTALGFELSEPPS